MHMSNRNAYEARVKRGVKELGFITSGAKTRDAAEGQFEVGTKATSTLAHGRQGHI